MDKGPERVRVLRLWHWFSSPGRVKRPGGLNQCHNLHTSTIRVTFMQNKNYIDLKLFKNIRIHLKIESSTTPSHHWLMLTGITWHITKLRHIVMWHLNKQYVLKLPKNILIKIFTLHLLWANTIRLVEKSLCSCTVRNKDYYYSGSNELLCFGYMLYKLLQMW